MQMGAASATGSGERATTSTSAMGAAEASRDTEGADDDQ